MKSYLSSRLRGPVANFSREIFFILFTIISLGMTGFAYAVPANCINATTSANLPPNQRPLSDWLLNQGQTVRGTINGVTLHAYPFFLNSPELSLAYDVDYSGVRSCDLGLPPPIIDGKVTERALADGRAEVTVNLHVTKALTYAVNSSVITTNPALCTANSITSRLLCPTLFGYGIKDLAFNKNLPTALGEAYVEIKFYNTAPGAQLPDFNALLTTNNLIFIGVSSSANGELRAAFGVPDGTPGRAQTIQIGLFNPGAIDNTDAKVPGIVKLQVVGK